MCADKPEHAPPAPPQQKLVGQVSPEERDEIRALFERKNGLAELCRSLATMTAKDLESSPLYERLVADMGKTATDFQQWWLTKANEHQWEGSEVGHWTIDFGTCCIYLDAPS